MGTGQRTPGACCPEPVHGCPRHSVHRPPSTVHCPPATWSFFPANQHPAALPAIIPPVLALCFSDYVPNTSHTPPLQPIVLPLSVACCDPVANDRRKSTIHDHDHHRPRASFRLLHHRRRSSDSTPRSVLDVRLLTTRGRVVFSRPPHFLCRRRQTGSSPGASIDHHSLFVCVTVHRCHIPKPTVGI